MNEGSELASHPLDTFLRIQRCHNHGSQTVENVPGIFRSGRRATLPAMDRVEDPFDAVDFHFDERRQWQEHFDDDDHSDDEETDIGYGRQ